MKRFIRPVSVLLLVVLMASLQSCSRPIDRTGFLPPVKITIPDDVKNDSATLVFIKSSEKVINNLSDRMEDIAVNGKNILSKKEDDLSVLDKIKLTKMSVQFISVGNSLANELEKVQKYVNRKQEEGITETDLKVYRNLEKAIEKRIAELNKKYKHLIN